MLKISRVIDVVITCNICLENVYNCTCNKKRLTKTLSSTLNNTHSINEYKSEKNYFRKFLSKKWSIITNLSFIKKKEEEEVVRLKNFYKNLLIHFSYLDENEVLKNTTIESKNGNWKFT